MLSYLRNNHSDVRSRNVHFLHTETRDRQMNGSGLYSEQHNRCPKAVKMVPHNNRSGLKGPCDVTFCQIKAKSTSISIAGVKLC